ncbi:MAG TPA: MauE/DoxX family redox-associated membrane protein [Ignavibacteria bacterium]|nr:MauE/DoxX family redox-associated membrane protein [Ignavibacteria bacterium]
MTIFRNKYFLLTLRIIIGGLFIWAAIVKISDPKAFATMVKGYKLFPLWSINLIAIILPFVELITGLLMIFGKWIRANSVIISILLILFIIGLAQAYIRGLDINCGCFSTSAASTPSDILWTIVRDIFMLIATFIIYIFSETNKESIKINNGGIKND